MLHRRREAVGPAGQNYQVTFESTSILPAVAVPTEGINPRVSLASTLQSSRTTAVLLGSGISSAAGIPTGWDVTLDLVRRVAIASGVDVAEGFDAEVWWRSQGLGEPGYDTLAAGLAPSDHDRRSLLRRYFEVDQRTNQLAVPTAAHRDLAALIARGSVPVVVTTNFDQLLERALAEVGVTPQVLSSAAHVLARTPLVHSEFTLVKLHGDYASGKLRNAPKELASYPLPWRQLLRQIFDEYGLLVVGWSAQYDVALVDAIRTTVGRRYAWYWAARGELKTEARKLTAARHAHIIRIRDCDELLHDIRTQVANLEQIAGRGRVWKLTHSVNPIGYQRPQGWSCMPCVVIRTTATLSGVDPDATGLLLEDVRTRLATALDSAPLTLLLRDLSDRPAVSAVPQQTGQPATAESPTTWTEPGPMVEVVHGLPLEPHQSGSDAVLRCGSDGSAGVTALVEVHLLGSLGVGNQPSVTLDVGLSVSSGASVPEVAQVQRVALDAIVNAIVPALSDVLPAGSGVSRLETSWDSPTQFDSINRPVPDEVGLDRTLLGPSTRAGSATGAYAEMVSPPFTTHALAELVHRAWQTTAINGGYLHAQQPLTVLLQESR